MSLPLWMIVRGSADGEAEAWRHVGAGRAQEALLVLPVAIGPAGVAVVLHVEDRDMGAMQDLAAAIDDVAQLHAAADIAGRRRRAHGGKGPIDGRATPDGDGVAAGLALPGGRSGTLRAAPRTPAPVRRRRRSVRAPRTFGPARRSGRRRRSRAWHRAPASRGSRPTVTSRRRPSPPRSAPAASAGRRSARRHAAVARSPDRPAGHHAPRSTRPATGWAGCSGRIHGRARCRRAGPRGPASAVGHSRRRRRASGPPPLPAPRPTCPAPRHRSRGR